MPLRDIVDVQIDRQTTPVSRAGFGTLLIVVESADTGAEIADAERVRTYGSIDEVGEDFTSDDAALLAATAAFSQEPRPVQLKVGLKGTDEDYDEALDAITDLDPDWYGIVIESREDADIENVADWVEARTKLYLAASDSAGVLDPQDDTDIASTLQAASYARTGLIYHGDAGDDEYPDAAWMGRMLPTDPGSATWAFKTLAGVPAEAFTGEERGALEDKNANWYEEVAGVAITRGGTSAEDGTYLDITRGIDWLEARLAEDVFTAIANAQKIPFTDLGVAQIEAAIRARLQIAIDREVLAAEPEPDVDVPAVADVPASERADRILPDVSFTATLAGAVHRVEIRGVVSV